MHILEALYRGRINTDLRTIVDGSEYDRLTKCLHHEYEYFKINLSPDDQKHFDQFDILKNKMCSIETEDAFISGFQLGVRLLLAAIGEYQGQFKSENQS
ncbi:MAG: hypothetical protein IJX53_08030 [Clostridia bacterium]|nr:hypothetical protein [Clostridia bacterium]